MVSHAKQQAIWEREHKKPKVLPQMDSHEASSGVIKFYEWLRNGGSAENLQGIEMCCGKGRNAIWLAQQGVQMTGVDFSPSAIQEAKTRAKEVGVSEATNFIIHDVTLPFPFRPSSFDFAIDCFGSTDLETPKVRQAALQNLKAVLKNGGYLLTYLLSTDDEFQAEMIQKNPGPEAGSFIHPVNDKFEKAFTEDEVRKLHSDMNLVVMKRLPKKVTFFGREYNCRYIWAIWQKGAN